MPFLTNVEFAKEVGDAYGTYVATFRSTNDQVRAELFSVGGHLVAHVSFSGGFDLSSANDPFLNELRSFAKEHGFEGKLKLIFAE